MTVQIEFWQLLSALAAMVVAFLGFASAAGRMLLNQIDRRLEDRFKTIEESLSKVSVLEKQLLEMKANLPLMFVLRDDYVRNQTVIEAKLDAVARDIQTISRG